MHCRDRVTPRSPGTSITGRGEAIACHPELLQRLLFAMATSLGGVLTGPL